MKENNYKVGYEEYLIRLAEWNRNKNLTVKEVESNSDFQRFLLDVIWKGRYQSSQTRFLAEQLRLKRHKSSSLDNDLFLSLKNLFIETSKSRLEQKHNDKSKIWKFLDLTNQET